MSRELTAKEKRVIAQSVMKQCANYCNYYKECLPEEANCYMMTIGFDDTPLCRYYEKCILPIEAEVAAVFQKNVENLRSCPICGRPFQVFGNQKYCSAKCTQTAKKKADAKRQKKRREKKHR